MNSRIVRGKLLPSKHGDWQVQVVCPNCGSVHTHGAGPDGRRLGWRLPQCRRAEDRERGQYDIVLESEEA